MEIFMTQDPSDRDFSSAIYDVMRDLATHLSGRYVEWMHEATTPEAEAHWREEHFRVMREVRAVDPDSRSAIEAHTALLRDALAQMPRYAPPFPAE